MSSPASAPIWADLRGTLPGPETYERRELSDIERIVIHHVGAGVNRDFTAQEIAEYHVSQGWPGISYHFLAHPDGRLDYVGDILTVRYHVGLINRSSLGVCLAGDLTSEEPTLPMLASVKRLIPAIYEMLGHEVPVVGHRDVWQLTGRGWTECPGNTYSAWLPNLTS